MSRDVHQNRHRFSVSVVLCLILSFISRTAQGCTDILVTPGASTDNSAMIAYNADSPTLYGVLYHYPATNRQQETATNSSNLRKDLDDEQPMRSVYDWDSGVFLGRIPEAAETYNVVGNSNEHGLVIGESTFGGVSILAYNQTGAIMDYGSLIYITLQRAKTATEAIHTMVDLMDTYGYYSGGESFSISDPSGDVWIFEVIGRGTSYGKLGAVYVAQKIPDGSITAHANQARITTFARDDPDNCLYAPDVVDVAVYYGLYPADADPMDFSFSDVYDPVVFISARQAEARVWSIFSQIADPSGSFQQEYQAYAEGKDRHHRMPLYIQPYKKVSVTDVMHLMTSHYEGTVLDSAKDVGAGLFESPYRPRPLVWSHNGTDYHNERSIATPKTGWSFVAQIRPWMPRELATIVWFACDDSSTAPRVPVYSSSTDVSRAYKGKGSQDGVVTPLLEFDMNKAFWVQNMVSNFAYYRWKDVYPVLRTKIDSIQEEFLRKVTVSDYHALKIYQEDGPSKAVAFASNFSVRAGDHLHETWMQFYGELFVRFRDFYTIVPKADEKSCGCDAIQPGLSDTMKRRIIDDTGDHYKVDQQPNSKLSILVDQSSSEKSIY